MNKRLSAVSLMILIGLLFSSCASLPSASPEVDLRVKNSTPPSDMALLFVYELGQTHGDPIASVTIDEKLAGNVGSDQYLAWFLEPGLHSIAVKSPIGGDLTLTSLEAKPGRTYYLTWNERKDRNAKLVLKDQKEGQEAMKSYRLGLRENDDAEHIPTILAVKREPIIPASASGASHTVASTKTVKSDVDDLPVLKSKSNKMSYAIIIGVEQYRQKLPKADFAVQDALLVSNYLTGVLGYPKENVVTLTNDNATNVDLVKYFEKWLPNNVEPGSTVFIYYSGHGAPNPTTGDAYLVPYDGDPMFIDETGYSLKRMYDALGKLPAKEVLVALDSCFSGAGGRSVIAKGARPLVMNLKSTASVSKNVTVLAASSGDQISMSYDEKGHGLFTYFMLKAIKDEDVVRPDGSLKMTSLYNYIKPQVQSIARKKYNNEQTPQLIEGKK
ncbi:MAG: caspase family protein [Nitrospiraceae bacterium]|nr:caspase family protein [Nitrospiraceae bacterium]